MNQSLDSILLLQKSDFNGKRIAVMREYMEELPHTLAVSDQIKQVFLNLLTNAADACDKPDCVIKVSTWKDNDKVAVAITDIGVGIKPENLEQIFQPFYTTNLNSAIIVTMSLCTLLTYRVSPSVSLSIR